MAKPIVALVGRPNVGKSTLFNRIVGERLAVIEDLPGTTRDRLYADADWAGREFTLVDTGGFELAPGSDLARSIREQTEEAIAEADVIVFVVDGQAGITPADLEVGSLLRAARKPVLVAVSKAESDRVQLDAVEFYELGLQPLFPVSGIHGTGTGDLLDAVVERIPAAEPEEAPNDEVRVALIGRPNVGKSSLVNALLGRERVIVSPNPGTTRDAIDTPLDLDGRTFVLVDTAGMRRRGRIVPGVEKFSVIRALRSIDRADVVGLVLDSSEGVSAQDTHLAGFAREAGKGIMFLLNKTDLVSSGPATRPDLERAVREDMNFVPWAPVLHVSAKTLQNVDRILPEAARIADERTKRVPTAALNDFVSRATHAHNPPSTHGRALKIYYATQVTVDPPAFVFFVNDPRLVHFAYQRYLENRLREAFGFTGTAIRLFFRARERRAEGKAVGQ